MYELLDICTLGVCFEIHRSIRLGYWELENIENEWVIFNPLSANATKWSNTLKQFVRNTGKLFWMFLTILLGSFLKGEYFNLHFSSSKAKPSIYKRIGIFKVEPGSTNSESQLTRRLSFKCFSLNGIHRHLYCHTKGHFDVFGEWVGFQFWRFAVVK